MSKYFGDKELACKCCGELKINPMLKTKLDQLRELAGEPLELSCAYRCSDHNEEVGGVPNSQHVLGNAADVIVPDDMTVDELAELAEEAGFDGIGSYYDDEFVHVDVRDDGESPAEYTWEG